MACNNKYDEIIVCNTLFKYDLVNVSDGVYDLVCTPCNVPTAVYNVGRITRRENSCNQIEFYQGFINCDPVEIIQDCSLECLIRRMIETYFNNIPDIECNNNSCRYRNTGLGIF